MEVFSYKFNLDRGSSFPGTPLTTHGKKERLAL